MKNKLIFALALQIFFMANMNALVLPDNFRGYVAYRGNRGLGYTSALTSVEGMWFSDSCLGTTFVDVRGHWLRRNQYAFNVGVGIRRVGCENVYWGANLFYDYRKTRFSHYDRIGFGGEYFRDAWEFRVNGYFSLERQKKVSQTFTYPGGLFARNHLQEYPFSHIQAELGQRISICGFCPYLALGGYYIKSRVRHQGVGGLLKVRDTFYEYFTVELSTTYDRVFKGIFQAAIIVEFPWQRGIPCNARTNQCCRDVLHERVYRDDIIPIKRSCHWTTNY